MCTLVDKHANQCTDFEYCLNNLVFSNSTNHQAKVMKYILEMRWIWLKPKGLNFQGERFVEKSTGFFFYITFSVWRNINSNLFVWKLTWMKSSNFKRMYNAQNIVHCTKDDISTVTLTLDLVGSNLKVFVTTIAYIFLCFTYVYRKSSFRCFFSKQFNISRFCCGYWMLISQNCLNE